MILALLRAGDPTVTADQVEGLLAEVAPAPNSRSQLTKHLTADPGVLTDGGSRMRKVVGEFIYAAIDAGVGGLVSPACALCSRPRTLFHSYEDDQRICTSCYSRLRVATCVACERQNLRIMAVTDAGPVCGRCHQKTRPREGCADCGRKRVLTRSRDDGRGYCRGCRAQRTTTETCAGCGRDRRVNARTDDGDPHCSSCYSRARTNQDECDECGAIGPLATRSGGRRDGSRNLCVRCYRHPARPCGVCGRLRRVALRATATSPDVCPTCYQAPVIDCSICGQQALGRRTTHHGRPRCFACQAAQQIDAALTGPDGMIRTELIGVRDALTALERPRSLLTNWHDLASLRLLTSIARGEVDLSHDALDARPQVFSVTYLRAMLVAAGALPPRDENAARLHRYAAEVVAQVTDPEMRGVLTRYARWHVVGRVKTDRHDRIAPNAAARCRGDIDIAYAFLDHLTSGDYDLDDCPQAHLDAWITTGRSRRLGFVRWLKRGGYLSKVQLPEPVPVKDPAHDVDPEEQLALARHLLHEPGSASVEDRAAACLILLYAQPVAKIAALTTSDIDVREGETYLHLGTEPLLLIPPLDELVTALPAGKRFGAASTLADSRWLFTGRNAGTHLHPASLMRRMHRLGVEARTSRNTALLHLASTTPPAVFASLVGVSIGTATRWAGLAGASWNRYATLPR